MTRSIRRWAWAAALAAVPAVCAADPPKPPAGSGILNPSGGSQLHAAGQIVVKLTKAGDGTITVKLPTPQRTANRGRRGGGGTRLVGKDHDFDLAPDALIRWHDLPKKPDGKPYTNEEYKQIRAPTNAVGFKADVSDLKPGQTVRLYLGRASKNDDPVVMTVLILAEPPKPAEKKK